MLLLFTSMDFLCFTKDDCRFKLMGKIMTKKDALVTIAKTAMYAGTSKRMVVVFICFLINIWKHQT